MRAIGMAIMEGWNMITAGIRTMTETKTGITAKIKTMTTAKTMIKTKIMTRTSTTTTIASNSCGENVFSSR
jgi:hypothetical protein